MGLLLLLFNIFKVIAIILLIFISIAFILICLVLFVPIKYDICIKKYDKVEVTIIFTWLLKFLTYSFNIKDEENYKQLKLAGINLWDNKKKEKKKKIIKKNKKSKSLPENIEINEKENYINNKAKNNSNVKKVNKIELEKDLEATDIDDITSSKENLEYLKSIFYKIKYILQYKEKDIIIKHTKNLISKLFKVIKPNKIIFDCCFGFDDPSLTGYILGFISVLSTFIPFDLNIEGNFEKEIFNLNIKMNGKANLWSIGFPILIYILKKPIWKIIKDRKEDI